MESLYIVDVSVLVKGLRAPSVSFFSKDNPEVGSVVTVPFRNQSRPALVVGVSSARQAKTAIKSASFSLKKVSMSEGVCIFSRAGVNTLFSLADFYATSPGEVLRALFPAFLTLHINELATVSWGKSRKQRQQTNTKTRASYLEAPLALRLAHYAKAAADFLAKGESTLILAPTVERVRFVSKELGKELGEKQVIELSSRLSHKRLLESWNRAVKTDKPVVVVATASFLALPLYNPGLYILEGESENYQSRTRPYIDARQALETLAQEGGVDILAGDFYVSAATVHHLSAVATSDAALTPPCSGNTEIIDMKPPQDEGESDTKTQSKQPRFTIFSEELLAALKETERRGEQAFLFVARRGLFPSTACSDCSELVTCPSCGAGLVLHEDKKQERFFL